MRRGYLESGDFDQRQRSDRSCAYTTLPLVFNSKSRDQTQYPNDNSYKIHIRPEIKNVSSIELLGVRLPKTEYNVHSSNNKIDVSIGSGITAVNLKNYGYGYTTAPSTTNGLIQISSSGGTGASISTSITNGKITSISIDAVGSGYDSSVRIHFSSPLTKAGAAVVDSIKVGYNFTATLREGQYTIGGNPTLTVGATSSTLVADHAKAMPPGLIREVQDQLNYNAPTELGGGGGISFTQGSAGPFTVRLVSQYPTIDYAPDGSSTSANPNAADTNCCLANRIQITLLGADSPVDNTTDINYLMTDSASYTSFENSYGPATDWQLLFVSGSNNESSAKYVLGFSHSDLSNATTVSSETKGSGLSGGALSGTLANNLNIVSDGYAYRGINDYNLHDYPKECIINFSINSSSISRIKSNSREINDSFCLLLFDSNEPDVLSNLGTGVALSAAAASAYTDDNGPLTGSIVYNAGNQALGSSSVRYLSGPQGKYQRYAVDSSAISSVTGYSGAGTIKPLKGADFDKKFIEFNPPLSSINDISIDFYKSITNGDKLHYDFQGRDHTLIFQITTQI